MIVKELIEELLKLDSNAVVYVPVNNHDGCDSCGYGSTTTEKDIDYIEQIGEKVWINLD